MAHYSPCHLTSWSWSDQALHSPPDDTPDDDGDSLPPVKQESIDPACHFIMESFPAQPPPAQPIQTKVPLRAQGPLEMRNLMSIIRTDPFEIHATGERRRPKTKKTSPEARPHTSEPLMFEFQLDLIHPILDQRDELAPISGRLSLEAEAQGLRSFSPDFDLHELQIDLDLQSDSSQDEQQLQWKHCHTIDNTAVIAPPIYQPHDYMLECPPPEGYLFSPQQQPSRHSPDPDLHFSQRLHNPAPHPYFQKSGSEDYANPKIHRSQYHQACRDAEDTTRITAPRPWHSNVPGGYHDGGLMGVASSRSTRTDPSVSNAPGRRWSLPDTQVQQSSAPVGFLM